MKEGYDFYQTLLFFITEKSLFFNYMNFIADLIKKGYNWLLLIC